MPQRFSSASTSVLNAYSFLILESLVAEPPHAAKAVEVDGLELVVENPYDLILGKSRQNRGWCFWLRKRSHLWYRPSLFLSSLELGWQRRRQQWQLLECGRPIPSSSVLVPGPLSWRRPSAWSQRSAPALCQRALVELPTNRGLEEAAVWLFWDNCWLRCRISWPMGWLVEPKTRSGPNSSWYSEKEKKEK